MKRGEKVCEGRVEKRNKKNEGAHGLCLVQEPVRTAFFLVSLFAPCPIRGVTTACSALIGVLLMWKVLED
jgi:hypothetical protein